MQSVKLRVTDADGASYGTFDIDFPCGTVCKDNTDATASSSAEE